MIAVGWIAILRRFQGFRCAERNDFDLFDARSDALPARIFERCVRGPNHLDRSERIARRDDKFGCAADRIAEILELGAERLNLVVTVAEHVPIALTAAPEF